MEFHWTLLLTTRFAGKRLFARMYPLVVVQRGQLFERTVANRTHVRLLVAVVKQMLVVGLLKRERFVADSTGIRHLTCKMLQLH